MGLGIRVDPRLGEMNDEPFGVVAGLEPIRQPADRMRPPLAVPFPGNLCPRRPLLVALVERCKRDDEPVIVIEVCHVERNYKHVTARLPPDSAVAVPFVLKSEAENPLPSEAESGSSMI